MSLVEARGNDDFSYTPAQAALILRVSPTRVRQLLQEGELEGERDEAGHWLIPARAVHDRLERLRRESFMEAVGYDPLSVREMRGLVEDLREQVRYLRSILSEEREARRRADTIIAQLTQANAALTQRIPELEAPAGERPPDAPRGAAGGASREEAPPAEEGPPETREYAVTPSAESGKAEPRSWWRRVFGG
jgi:excisionase family DNA binding protein